MVDEVTKGENTGSVKMPIWNKIILAVGALALMDYLFGNLFTTTAGGVFGTELMPWYWRYLGFAVILLLLWAKWKEKMMKWKALQRLSGENGKKDN